MTLTAINNESDESRGDRRETVVPGELPHDTEAERQEGPSVHLTLPSWLNPAAATWVWFGVVVMAIGFGLIGVAWGDVAGQTQVYKQLPYLASAGLTGLGLIMVGLTTINVATRHRDARDRDRQIDRLAAIMEAASHPHEDDES